VKHIFASVPELREAYDALLRVISQVVGVTHGKMVEKDDYSQHHIKGSWKT
jgi:hypothetical protein